MNKRLVKELLKYYNEDKPVQYILKEDPTDINKIHIMLKGPDDSLYKHKFMRFIFTIDESYPFNPPKAEFINHDGTRIHPNLYGTGKVCLSMLNTWSNPTWNASYTIDSIMITIQSILDKTPYVHEPHQKDCKIYNRYVDYNTWITCFLNHLKYETIDEFVEYMHIYLIQYKDDIFKELDNRNVEKIKGTPYGMSCITDYKKIKYELENYIAENNLK